MKQYANTQQLNIIAPEEPEHIHTVNPTTGVLDIAVIKNCTWNMEIQRVT